MLRGKRQRCTSRKLVRTTLGKIRAWQTICDLRDLRHLIVHRAGTKGESDEHRLNVRAQINKRLSTEQAVFGK